MTTKPLVVEKIAAIINSLDVLGIVLVLAMAFIFQFVFNELPCPLCLLQRAGFLITSIGFLLNLRYGVRPGHYVLSLLGALLTAFIALRQIALHVIPGTGAYGSSILGMHMYTWSFVLSMVILVFTSLTLGLDAQYRVAKKKPLLFMGVTHTVFILVLIIAVLNVISVFSECGFMPCPDNPM